MKLLKLIPDNTNIRFLRWRVPFYVVSLLLMAASVGLLFTKGLNLGVDFVGGQMIRMTFVEQQAAPLADLRERIDRLGELPMWKGDRLFLPLVFDGDPRPFHGWMRYDGEEPADWRVSRF